MTVIYGYRTKHRQSSHIYDYKRNYVAAAQAQQRDKQTFGRLRFCVLRMCVAIICLCVQLTPYYMVTWMT